MVKQSWRVYWHREGKTARDAALLVADDWAMVKTRTPQTAISRVAEVHSLTVMDWYVSGRNIHLLVKPKETA